jgi:2-phosphosulfolactate phosphatase
MKRLEVLFTPADFQALQGRSLSETICVVFDLLRATSTMVTAMAHGAESITPLEKISDALQAKIHDPDLLLAGERNGLRISSELTGGVAFDLGNSPREFTGDVVLGKRIAMTTTNGTLALRACLKARTLLIGSFLNLTATADFLQRERPEDVLLVCAGTGEGASYEDLLGAGSLCHRLVESLPSVRLSDSARIACKLYLLEQSDLFAAFAQSCNGVRLLSIPDLKEDVAFCARRDLFPIVGRMEEDGSIRRV